MSKIFSLPIFFPPVYQARKVIGSWGGEGGRKQLPEHFIHVRFFKLFCMTAEHCELKQLVPPVSLREPTAMRYNCDDTTVVELGQTYGHFKAECQPFLSTSVI